MCDWANEPMIDVPDERIRALVDFWGLHWDSDCLKFHEKKCFVDSFSYDQMRRRLNDGSVGRRTPGICRTAVFSHPNAR